MVLWFPHLYLDVCARFVSGTYGQVRQVVLVVTQGDTGRKWS